MKDDTAVWVADLSVAFHVCGFTSRCCPSLGCAKSRHFLRTIATILRKIQQKETKNSNKPNEARCHNDKLLFTPRKAQLPEMVVRAITQRVTSSEVTQVWLAFLTNQFCEAVIKSWTAWVSQHVAASGWVPVTACLFGLWCHMISIISLAAPDKRPEMHEA